MDELKSVVELYVMTRSRVAREKCDTYQSMTPPPKDLMEKVLRAYDMPTCME